MRKRNKTALVLFLLVCAAVGALVLWRGRLQDEWIPYLGKLLPRGSISEDSAREGSKQPEPDAGESSEQREPVVSGTAEGLRAAAAPEPLPPLPPSPPLPAIPPDASQVERREAFQLRESVDHIVRKDEPFEVGGKKITIGDILGAPPEVFPSIVEKDIGSMVRRPIFPGSSSSPGQGHGYYGVRHVRPAENIWGIHHAMIREYFARRRIILPKDADKPASDGRSSGVGKLLKFIEGIVYVYNLDKHSFEKDPDRIQPYSIIVFFKISDFFAALDDLQPQDLASIRYVSNSLRLERNRETRDLLDRRALLE